MRSQSAITALLLALIFGGCRTAAVKTDEVSEEDLSAQVEQLRREVTEKQKRIEEQSEQLAILRGFSAERLGRLVRVKSIEFGRFTLGYDDTKDGIDEGINVYLYLRDGRGDKIKAAGVVELELWDLGVEEGQALLGQWQYGLEQLGDYWIGALISHHYKFKLPWPGGIGPVHDNLTLRCKFKDALTGSEFEIQKLITVSLMAGGVNPPSQGFLDEAAGTVQ